MNKLLLVIALLASAGVAHADSIAAPVYDTLPRSNEANPPATVVAATTTVITLSSYTATNIAANIDAYLLATLGATYNRYEVSMQVTGSTDAYVGYSTSTLTLLSGGDDIGPTGSARWALFTVGRAVPVYAVSGATSTAVRISGSGWAR